VPGKGDRRGDGEEKILTRFAIAGIQMRVSATEDNVATMCHRLATLMAIYPWVRMVVFSELAVSGPLPQAAQPIPGPAEEALRAMAAKHDLWLVSGSMYESSGHHVYNTASVIDPDGAVVGRYRKMFPFEPYELGISAGDEFLVFDVPDVGRFGLYICYDMWFPETSRTLAVMGAEVILRPTLTGTIDRDVELSIARHGGHQPVFRLRHQRGRRRRQRALDHLRSRRRGVIRGRERGGADPHRDKPRGRPPQPRARRPSPRPAAKELP
jgi:hypothetical protein